LRRHASRFARPPPERRPSPPDRITDVVARDAHDPPRRSRLIRKQSAVNNGATYIQSKDFYYDGVRHIQEVIFRPPVQSGLFEPEHGNDEGVILPEVPLEPVQIILGEDPGSIGDLQGVIWTDREYIYDPAGDVDAFICQIDRQNRVMYMLQDANLNVVGLTVGPSPTTAPWPQPVGTLLEQYVYEPYGRIVKSDSFHDHPVNRVGHQGLFFERYNAEFNHQNLAQNANGLYYNRNRFYHPGLGRFTTRDPNETGMPILAALAMNGTSIDVFFGGFSGQSMYGDGMNLYEYENSNPISHRDALGLYDDFDDMISDINGNRLYMIGTINEGARVAAIGLGLALDIAMGFMPGAGIYDAVQSIKALGSGGGGFGDAMNVLSVAMPAARMLSGGIDALRSMSKARGYARRACNSFVAGTPVGTPDGPTAIECLKEGDVVWTQPQDRPDQPVRQGRVTRLFRSVAPAILWITLSTGDTVGATPGHKVWTFEKGWTTAERLAVGETFRTIDDKTAVVIDLRLDPTPTPVYDLEVDGTFTYFVNGVWVHNQKCNLRRAAFTLFDVRRLPDSELFRKPGRRGNAPLDRNNRPIEIHHVDQNIEGPFVEIRGVDHRGIPNPNPGLTPDERNLFNQAKERYWQHQWDLGRFNHLPG